MIKIINTRLHGLMDYISGFILLLPWILGFFQTSNDTFVLAAVGALTITLSLLTDYEFGIIKLVPMKMHLVADVITALFLIIFPFAFPIYHYSFHWPVVLGCVEMIIIFLSSSSPYIVTRKDRIIN